MAEMEPLGTGSTRIWNAAVNKSIEIFRARVITIHVAPPIGTFSYAGRLPASEPGHDDLAYTNWRQFLTAPKLQGRDDNYRNSRQAAVFKDIEIPAELLRAHKEELTLDQKSVLGLALQMITDEDVPMHKAKREGDQITAEFGNVNKLNIHNAFAVACYVNENKMTRLIVGDRHGNPMAELNLNPSDAASSNSRPLPVPPQSARQRQLLASAATLSSAGPRKRSADEMDKLPELLSDSERQEAVDELYAKTIEHWKKLRESKLPGETLPPAADKEKDPELKAAFIANAEQHEGFKAAIRNAFEAGKIQLSAPQANTKIDIASRFLLHLSAEVGINSKKMSPEDFKKTAQDYSAKYFYVDSKEAKAMDSLVDWVVNGEIKEDVKKRRLL